MTKRIRVRRCKLADQEHDRSLRQYAHVFHHPGTICVARAFFDLPLSFQLGILMHEIGHLINGPDRSEEDADRAALQHAGIRIERVDSPYGENLEWVPPSDRLLAASLVRDLTDYDLL